MTLLQEKGARAAGARRQFTRTELYGAIALGVFLLGLLTFGWLSAR